MTVQYLIGIDVGTSGTKVLLTDTAGRIAASVTKEYALYQPQSGWAEQDPADWWQAACEGIREVLEKSGIRAAQVACIGLTGQMHGMVMLDQDDRVLRRAILWCDQRTEAECEQIISTVGHDRYIQIAANPPLTGFSCPKILWVKKHEPDIYRQCAHILLPKDYIRFCLTGNKASEVTDASGHRPAQCSRARLVAGAVRRTGYPCALVRAAAGVQRNCRTDHRGRSGRNRPAGRHTRDRGRRG